MSARLDLAGALVSPFQYPRLKETADVMTNGAAAPLAHGGEAPPAAADDASDDVVQAEAAVAEGFARGHGEGLQRGIEEGRQQGFEAGFAQGAEAAEARVMEIVERLTALVTRLGGPLAALDQPVEEAVAALALEVARCVICDEVERSHEFLVGLIREAIAKVPLDMGSPRVVLNPADLELVRNLAPDIESGNATLVADDTVEAGGCFVIADGDDRPIADRRWNTRLAEGVSQVDLTLPARWRAVMLALFDAGGQ